MWQPNSPDTNPLEYYVWGEIERDNKTPCITKNELKTRIIAINIHQFKQGDRLEKFQEAEVVWRPWLKPMVILLNNCTY